MRLCRLGQLIVFLVGCAQESEPDASPDEDEVDLSLADWVSPYYYKRFADPDRTAIYDAHGTWLATFTDDAYTVRLRGPKREISEPGAEHFVTTTRWIRVLEGPFDGEVDVAWLSRALVDTSADVIAVALEYIAGAPPNWEDGLQIAGDAKYGPVGEDGIREPGSDFNDYLGVTWDYQDGVKDRPESHQLRSLDCSGYMRMVWGYRKGVPLGLYPDSARSTMPRRAFEIFDWAPGVVIIDDRIDDSGAPAEELSALEIGDLVFFDADDESDQIDHVGMYLGRDEMGRRRFISSRKTANGPTMGDTGGSSLLEGSGVYARAFRGARRL